MAVPCEAGSRRLVRPDLGDRLFAAGIPCHLKGVAGLQVHPELRGRLEVGRQAQRGVGAERMGADLGTFSAGGIRFTYNAVWAAATPTLEVKLRVNDGVSTTYSVLVATQPSATNFTINWSQFLSGSSSLGDNLGRPASVNMVDIRATGFSSLVVSDLQVIPAPGAIALVGAAGLVGSRRRAEQRSTRSDWPPFPEAIATPARLWCAGVFLH